jgi:hypothetical protein
LEVIYMRKRFVPTLLALGLLAAVDSANVSILQTGSTTSIAFAQQNGGGGNDAGAAAADRNDRNAQVDINVGTPNTVEHHETTTWFADPLWIALAVGAVILIAVLFAASSRGGGTTIVKGVRPALATVALPFLSSTRPPLAAAPLALLAFLLELGDDFLPQRLETGVQRFAIGRDRLEAVAIKVRHELTRFGNVFTRVRQHLLETSQDLQFGLMHCWVQSAPIWKPATAQRGWVL